MCYAKTIIVFVCDCWSSNFIQVWSDFLFIILFHLPVKLKQRAQTVILFAFKITVHKRSTVLTVNYVRCVILPVKWRVGRSKPTVRAVSVEVGNISFRPSVSQSLVLITASLSDTLIEEQPYGLQSGGQSSMYSKLPYIIPKVFIRRSWWIFVYKQDQIETG